MKHILDFIKGRLKKMKTLEKKTITQVNTKTDWQKLCEECSFVAQKNGWTEKDADRLLKEVRKELKHSDTY